MPFEFSDEIADPATYLPGNVPGTAFANGERGAALEAVVEYVAALGYTYEPWQIAAFATAVRTKPFVILAGISGTGKTRLPQLVAAATGAECVVVPVRPDWTDSSDLLGYGRLDGRFVPGHLLRACKRAMREQHRQFFFILDEMNVARVEYYFAEVLSLMENRRRDDYGAVVTDPLVPTAGADDDAWPEVFLPNNLCIVGTVNMDETTHGFSRKVLDRAFVLELSDVDLADVRPAAETAPTANPWQTEAWAATSLRLAERQEDLAEVAENQDGIVTRVIQTLTRANQALSRAQLQVGYRVRDEIALFCLNAEDFAAAFVDAQQTVISPLDLCLSMKILPRIQGGGSFIRDVLSDLASWTDPGLADERETDEPAGFPRTSARVALMKQRLDQTGFTSYWI